MRKELSVLTRFRLAFSFGCTALVCGAMLLGTEASAISFMPNNDSPVDWNQADWTDLSGNPYASPPGDGTTNDVKIGRTAPGSVVGPSDNVVVNLNSVAGLGGTTNEIGNLEIVAYNDGLPQVNSGTLNIVSTGGGTLNVNRNTQIGRRAASGAGTGTATLLQTGGDVNFAAMGNASQRAFTMQAANGLAEFAGGSATFGRVKIGADPGNVAISSGTNVFRVSGGDVTLGTTQFSDFRMFKGASLEITGGTVTGVKDITISANASGVGGVDISGGLLTGVDDFAGLDVTVSGGSFVVGDDFTGSQSNDFTVLQLSGSTGQSSTYTMSGTGKTVFPVLSNGKAATLRLKDSSTGNLLGGTIEVDFTNAPTPAVGQKFTLLTEEGLGSFSITTSNIGAAPAGFDWDTSRWLDIFRLELIAATGLTGDYNGNGTVDAADYTEWRDGNSPDSSIVGYNTWVANFGNTSISTSTSVPEPTSLALLAMGSLLALSRRDR